MIETLYSHPLYQEDLSYLAGLPLPWEQLDGATVVISGASGMLGSLLVDAIMTRNAANNLGCRIYALGRRKEKLEARFSHWRSHWGTLLSFVEVDINVPLDDVALPEKAAYVIHLASNTHPVAYATDPVGTVLANVYGTRNLLDFAVARQARRFAFASSNEIYGENRGDVEKFDESYSGNIDCNTLRAGYPESKRCGEALCQAYRKQFGLDAVVPRFTRSYGPTLLPTDTKALSQFLRNALHGEDIVLKSAGEQFYSYLYATDSIAGFLTVLLKGEDGLAYNIADEKSDIRLKDLAREIASQVGVKVVFQLPNATEQAGFSKATKARLDSTRLHALGWTAKYDLPSGIRRTLDMLKHLS
jgi:nucleoside-diphosphate-sugar epimerase